jgi:hypothetical protein
MVDDNGVDLRESTLSDLDGPSLIVPIFLDASAGLWAGDQWWLNLLERRWHPTKCLSGNRALPTRSAGVENRMAILSDEDLSKWAVRLAAARGHERPYPKR